MVSAAPAAGYPLYWEADVLLADGGVAHLRPSGPADADAIRAMHGRSSPNSLYLRYFSPINTVSEEKIEIFTDVDHDSRVGLVAELAGEIIGAGTYHREPGGTRTPPRSRFWSRTRSRAAGSVRSCWSTWPRRPRSTGSAASPPRCSARTPRCSGCSSTPATPSTGSTTPVSTTWCSTSNPPRNPGR